MGGFWNGWNEEVKGTCKRVNWVCKEVLYQNMTCSKFGMGLIADIGCRRSQFGGIFMKHDPWVNLLA